MKRLHRPDLFTWSVYDADQQVDFNGVLWRREGGNVLFDPVRAARELAARTGARLLGPAGERETFPVPCERWLRDGDEPFPGLVVRELRGSKTDGELALVLDGTTALFGDLVRAHQAGALMLLRREKLRDPAAALDSVRGFRARHPEVRHVLVGDGWCAFGNGGELLDELLGGTAGR
jgi:hypothetical protein